MLGRRRLLATASAVGATLALPGLVRGAGRPAFTHGVQSGDVGSDGGMVWARTDRPCRIAMEWATTESFADPHRLTAIDALPGTDCAAKRLIAGLPPGQDIFYRMVAADLAEINLVSEPITGRFRTPPADRRSIRFAWSGDTAGHGWGIDATGMKTYAAIAANDPDFLIHSGDTVYADNWMRDEVPLPDGTLWRNVVLTDAKRKVAETLDEFRGQWLYNMLDRHVLALNAQMPVFMAWDDHEVANNRSPAKSLADDPQYTVKSLPLLTARGTRAFHEMTPVRSDPTDPARIYRRIAYGPLLDVFFLDLRSYRGPNTRGLEPTVSDASRIVGSAQLGWLMASLAASTATWKVIACDMPIGLECWDDVGTERFIDGIANGEPGPPLGRELEIADLLAFIKRRRIRNTVWLTAEVHYTAAHYYDPDKARFQEFDPFWEFVSGPLHANASAPNRLDPTFGPEVRFEKGPSQEQGWLPPNSGMMFFGLVDIEGGTGQLTVRLMDRENAELWRVTLDPAG